MRNVRFGRVLGIGLFVPIGIFATSVWLAQWSALAAHYSIGLDYRVLVGYGSRLLTTGSLYLPSQLAGPYEWATLPKDPLVAPLDPTVIPCVYPPLIALLVVPASLVPWPFWWACPLGVLIACMVRWRPRVIAWPILGALLAWPGVAATVAVGGTGMWMVAAIAAGLRFGWPIVLVLIKPTFAPLVIIGAWRRSFWIAMGVVAVVSLPLIGDWLRYPSVLANAWPISTGDITGNIPLIGLPLVAWLARTDRPAAQSGRNDTALAAPFQTPA